MKAFLVLIAFTIIVFPYCSKTNVDALKDAGQSWQYDSNQNILKINLATGVTYECQLKSKDIKTDNFIATLLNTAHAGSVHRFTKL